MPAPVNRQMPREESQNLNLAAIQAVISADVETQRRMNVPPSSRPRKYAWPKFVFLAAVAFGLLAALWLAQEVARIRRIKESQSTPPAFTSPPAPPTTNALDQTTSPTK